MPHVLNVGLDPATVDGSSSAFPAVSREEVEAGLASASAALADLGLGLDTCFVDPENAGRDLREALHCRDYEIVMIGAGVRLDPHLTPLLETVVNSVLAWSPRSAICFNTGPQTTVAAVRRWWPRPA